MAQVGAKNATKAQPASQHEPYRQTVRKLLDLCGVFVDFSSIFERFSVDFGYTFDRSLVEVSLHLGRWLAELTG